MEPSSLKTKLHCAKCGTQDVNPRPNSGARTSTDFLPPFPCLSTRKSHRPQDSHSVFANSHCCRERNARKFHHCKREGCAASDREGGSAASERNQLPASRKVGRWADQVDCWSGSQSV